MSMNTIKNDDIWLDVETVAKLKGITERGVRLAIHHIQKAVVMK